MAMVTWLSCLALGGGVGRRGVDSTMGDLRSCSVLQDVSAQPEQSARRVITVRWAVFGMEEPCFGNVFVGSRHVSNVCFCEIEPLNVCVAVGRWPW
jgi:hypothetical protein